jgi:hypothetical protein
MEACPKQHEGEMHNIIKLNFQSKKRHQSWLTFNKVGHFWK